MYEMSQVRQVSWSARWISSVVGNDCYLADDRDPLENLQTVEAADYVALTGTHFPSHTGQKADELPSSQWAQCPKSTVAR